MANRDEFRKATAKGAAMRSGLPAARAAHYDRRTARIVVSLASDLDISFAPTAAQGLERAKPADLAKIEISPSGFGLHFPALDADIYLPALLEGFFGSRKWMAARLGERGGRTKSLAKAKAARRNGRLGGRPKKTAA